MSNKKLRLQAAIILLMIFGISCDPFHNVIENCSNEETAVYYESKNIVESGNPQQLKIVTWNMKFGGARIDFFFDCYGDRVIMTDEEAETNILLVIDQIKKMNPDIIFIQEADVSSKRSAYIDQVQRILDGTDLNYGYYASQWKSDYVPSDGIGRVNSGNAILSKFKLADAQRIALPLIEEQSGLVQYFYLRRNILRATVDVNGKEIVLFNAHTAAYSTDGTRQKQLDIMKAKANEQKNAGKKVIIGGDFNTIPPNSTVYENFDDDKCAEGSDFASQSFKEDLDILKPFFNDFNAAIPQATYDTDNARYYSFTSDKSGFWNRKLDYIFTNGTFLVNSGIVHQDTQRGGAETMPLSDHAPISVTYVLD